MTRLPFSCPTCSSVLSSTVDKAGTKVLCPKCGQCLEVPPVPEDWSSPSEPLTATPDETSDTSHDSRYLGELDAADSKGQQVFILLASVTFLVGVLVVGALLFLKNEKPPSADAQARKETVTPWQAPRAEQSKPATEKSKPRPFEEEAPVVPARRPKDTPSPAPEKPPTTTADTPEKQLEPVFDAKDLIRTMQWVHDTDAKLKQEQENGVRFRAAVTKLNGELAKLHGVKIQWEFTVASISETEILLVIPNAKLKRANSLSAIVNGLTVSAVEEGIGVILNVGRGISVERAAKLNKGDKLVVVGEIGEAFVIQKSSVLSEQLGTKAAHIQINLGELKVK